MPPPPCVTAGENHSAIAKPTNLGRKQFNLEKWGIPANFGAGLLQLNFLDNEAGCARVCFLSG
ncbi:MAG: hypothetical protein ACM3SP_26210 [Chloroflexota bacterium]